jgi:putative redox protein
LAGSRRIAAEILYINQNAKECPTMATIQTTYLGDLRTESVHIQSNTRLITDAPTDNQGKGESFSPTDLLATAYGACVFTIMGIAAKTHGFSIDGATVETTKIMGTEPRRIVELVANFTFPANNYSAKQKKILELAAKECPVYNSLHPDLKKSVTFTYTA